MIMIITDSGLSAIITIISHAPPLERATSIAKRVGGRQTNERWIYFLPLLPARVSIVPSLSFWAASIKLGVLSRHHSDLNLALGLITITRRLAQSNHFKVCRQSSSKHIERANAKLLCNESWPSKWERRALLEDLTSWRIILLFWSPGPSSLVRFRRNEIPNLDYDLSLIQSSKPM